MHILLVEDNVGDVRLMREVLKEGGLTHSLDVAHNGDEAIRILRKEGAHIHAVSPDLIFLDLNLPGKHGREVLAEIKTDPELKRIPVIVLTTSEADQDILQSYNLHANCFITKPVEITEFLDVIKCIDRFWFQIVKLPSFP
jgi:CheY-like chemotaxis protein